MKTKKELKEEYKQRKIPMGVVQIKKIRNNKRCRYELEKRALEKRARDVVYTLEKKFRTNKRYRYELDKQSKIDFIFGDSTLVAWKHKNEH